MPEKTEHAFRSGTFPCNSKPFINRLSGIIDQANTNSLMSLEGEEKTAARGCLWILMSQLYGQMATIDLTEEWSYLNKTYRQ